MEEFNLKEVLEEKKISKYELAKESDVPYSTVHDICSRKKSFDNITFLNAVKILRFLYSDKELVEFIRGYSIKKD